VLPYDELGEGAHVLLIHAGVADRSMWRQHLDWLAEAGFHAVAVDLPGFGDAIVKGGPQAPWEDVLQTMQELGLERTVLIGVSFGAAVALRMVAIAPASAAAMVLVSPPPLELDPSPALGAAWEAEEAALERGDIDAAVEAVVNAWTQPSAPPALRDQVATMQRRAFELQADAAQAEEAADPLEQNPRALAALGIPVLVLAGGRDFPDFKRGAEEWASSIPEAQLKEIEEAGHLVPLETPDSFRALVLDFLQRLPANSR
jgi:pimeloyl-ACP methyl ester carboxylesterase